MANLNDILNYTRQTVKVLTDPAKSATLAGGLTGAFSARLNTLKHDLSGEFRKFGVKAGPLYVGGVGNIFSYILGEDQHGIGGGVVAAQSAGVPFWILVVGGGLVIYLILRGRK